MPEASLTSVKTKFPSLRIRTLKSDGPSVIGHSKYLQMCRSKSPSLSMSPKDTPAVSVWSCGRFENVVTSTNAVSPSFRMSPHFPCASWTKRSSSPSLSKSSHKMALVSLPMNHGRGRASKPLPAWLTNVLSAPCVPATGQIRPAVVVPIGRADCSAVMTIPIVLIFPNLTLGFGKSDTTACPCKAIVVAKHK